MPDEQNDPVPVTKAEAERWSLAVYCGCAAHGAYVAHIVVNERDGSAVVNVQTGATEMPVEFPAGTVNFKAPEEAVNEINARIPEAMRAEVQRRYPEIDVDTITEEDLNDDVDAISHALDANDAPRARALFMRLQAVMAVTGLFPSPVFRQILGTALLRTEWDAAETEA